MSFDPLALLAALSRHDVKYILIGQAAAFLHGHPEVTIDVELVPARDMDNVDRLTTALDELGAVHLASDGGRGDPVDDQDFIGRTEVQRFLTDAGPVDIIPYASGIGGYEDLAPRAARMDLGSAGTVLVAAIDDIIASKQASGRRRDLRGLPGLRAFRDGLARDTPPKD